MDEDLPRCEGPGRAAPPVLGLGPLLQRMLARCVLPSPHRGVVRVQVGGLQDTVRWNLQLPSGDLVSDEVPVDAWLMLSTADAEGLLAGHAPSSPVFDGDLELLDGLLGMCGSVQSWHRVRAAAGAPASGRRRRRS